MKTAVDLISGFDGVSVEEGGLVQPSASDVLVVYDRLDNDLLFDPDILADESDAVSLAPELFAGAGLWKLITDAEVPADEILDIPGLLEQVNTHAGSGGTAQPWLFSVPGADIETAGAITPASEDGLAGAFGSESSMVTIIVDDGAGDAFVA